MLTRPLTLITALLCAFAAAASEPTGFSVYPHSGVSEGSDIDGGHPRGIGIGYRFHSPWAVEFTYQSLDAGRDDGDVDVDTWRLDGIYRAAKYRALTPYFTVGLGASSYDHKTSSASTRNTKDETHLNAGFGLSWAMNDRTSLRGDVRLYHGSDDTEVSSTLALGVHHVFGETSWRRPAMGSTDADGDGVPNHRDRCPGSTDRRQVVDSRGCYPADGILNVKFDFDSFAAQPEHEAEVRRVAEYMEERMSTTVLLEGHTDSRGPAGYNQRLSERRAETIADMLITKFGIDANRVNTVGYGEGRPTSNNATPSGRRDNRRVQGKIRGDN